MQMKLDRHGVEKLHSLLLMIKLRCKCRVAKTQSQNLIALPQFYLNPQIL